VHQSARMSKSKNGVLDQYGKLKALMGSVTKGLIKCQKA